MQKSCFWANKPHLALRKGGERNQSLGWVGEDMWIGERVFLPVFPFTLFLSHKGGVRQANAQITGRIWEAQRSTFLPLLQWEGEFMWKFTHRLGDAHTNVPLECVVIVNLFLIAQYLHKCRKHLLPQKIQALHHDSVILAIKQLTFAQNVL